MFERFTDRTRRVLVLAQEEARLLNHNFIGSEHLLLGLIREGEGESVAAQVLRALGITLEAARTKVAELIRAAEYYSSTGSPPFTPSAKKVLEFSLREALQMGHNYIGTEHMLLGMIREGESMAVQVLFELGANRDQVRAAVLRTLDGHTDEPVRSWVESSPATRVNVRAPSGAAAAAVCPGCRIDLADTLRWRTQEVPGAEPTDPVRDVVVWWCRACGRTISVTPESSPRRARTVSTLEAIPESEEVRIHVTQRGKPLASMTGDLGSDWLDQPVVAEDLPLQGGESGDRRRALLEALLERIYDASSGTRESVEADLDSPSTTEPVESTDPPPTV